MKYKIQKEGSKWVSHSPQGRKVHYPQGWQAALNSVCWTIKHETEMMKTKSAPYFSVYYEGEATVSPSELQARGWRYHPDLDIGDDYIEDDEGGTTAKTDELMRKIFFLHNRVHTGAFVFCEDEFCRAVKDTLSTNTL